MWIGSGRTVFNNARHPEMYLEPEIFWGATPRMRMPFKSQPVPTNLSRLGYVGYAHKTRGKHFHTYVANGCVHVSIDAGRIKEVSP